PLINSVVVPLILLSGVMLPMTLGPGWLQGIARISPYRYIIDAMREAYAGQYWNTFMVEGLCVAVGTAALFMWLRSRVFVGVEGCRRRPADPAGGRRWCSRRAAAARWD